MYPILIFFLYWAPEIVELLYGPTYRGSAAYFRVSFVGNFFEVIAFVPIILALGARRLYAAVHLTVAVLAWVGGWRLLGPRGVRWHWRWRSWG